MGRLAHVAVTALQTPGTLLSVHIGESDHLSRRMGGYRNPAPTQDTNVRLAARLLAVPAAAGTTHLAIATEATIDGERLDSPTARDPMSQVELSDEALAAARREAQRRGVDVAEVVAEAVQRFVVGADLRELLEEFRRPGV